MKFDTKAATYEAHAHIQRDLAAWLAEWLEPVLPEDSRILEVGAGTGLFTRELIGLGKVEALERSQAMIDEGRAFLPFVNWHSGDAFTLPVACCDRLYSSALLQWTTNPALTAQNWFAALKPGGRMLHGLFVAPTLPELSALADIAPPVCWQNSETWLTAFKNAGFKILGWEESRRTQSHRSAQVLLRELHDTGVTPARARLSVTQLRHLLRCYDRLYTNTQGGVRSTWSLMRFEAEKPQT